MNQICMRKEKISGYKAVIFDLDGTLYYQNPFLAAHGMLAAGVSH